MNFGQISSSVNNCSINTSDAQRKLTLHVTYCVHTSMNVRKVKQVLF